MKHLINENNPEVLKERIVKALKEAREGQVDGAHHKAWSIDQMVRYLLGCERVVHEAHMLNGQLYMREELAPNLEYLEFVEEFEQTDEETGEKCYEWEVGIE